MTIGAALQQKKQGSSVKVCERLEFRSASFPENIAALVTIESGIFGNPRYLFFLVI